MRGLKTTGGVLSGVAVGLVIGSLWASAEGGLAVAAAVAEGVVAAPTAVGVVTAPAPAPTAPASAIGAAPQAPTTGLHAWIDASWAADGLWDDGNAELNLYRARLDREGGLRDHAYAAHIVVKEAFTPEYLVKADDWRAPGVFDVLKLNAVTYARTGLYDWHEMTSSFVDRSSMVPVKMTWGRQEWCGNSFKEWRRFGADRMAFTSSYFDGAGTRTGEHAIAVDAVPLDSLPVVLRALAFDRLTPGQEISFALVPALRDGRLAPVEAVAAELQVGAQQATTVPLGTFDTIALTIRYPGRRGTARSETYRIETAAPHRVVSIEGPAGESLELARSERLPYWQMAGEAYEWFPAPLFSEVGSR